MPISPPSSTDARRVLGLLALFILVFGLLDCARLHWLSDTFLPPSLEGEQKWTELRDWSAANCYPDDWKTALLGWASRRLSDAALVAVIVFAAHALLWSGVYYFGRALFEGPPWVALLGVVLVRICPDLFQIHLLNPQTPARMMAIALAFWSVGLTMRRRWVPACCAGGFIAHLSPTVACWFAQFLVVALLCLNYEWGWRKSLIGAACFLALAVGPLADFLVEAIVPQAPIAADATMGLHLFANPSLSPFSVPLWANACLVVYLAMAFVWMKRHYSRRTTPIVIIFFLLGLAGILLEIIFVGLIPVERAARFELPNLRAFWLLWIAIFYAPELADSLRAPTAPDTNPQSAIRNPQSDIPLWRPMFRGLSFSMPLVWSTLTLVERWHQPPRWNRMVLLMMLVVLFLTIHKGDRPIAEPLYALAIAAGVTMFTIVAALARRVPGSLILARALSGAVVLFVVFLFILDRSAVKRAFSETRHTMARNSDWTAACQWTADHAPADSVWSVPWRPRQFRRWTGRAVLVNRDEAPRDPSRRFEWFQMYSETHSWPGGVTLSPVSSRGGNPIVEWLRDYRHSFLFGVARRGKQGPDRLDCSSILWQNYGVHYAICDRGSPPQMVQERGGILLERLHTSGSFDLYRIQGQDSEIRSPKSKIGSPAPKP